LSQKPAREVSQNSLRQASRRMVRDEGCAMRHARYGMERAEPGRGTGCVRGWVPALSPAPAPAPPDERLRLGEQKAQLDAVRPGLLRLVGTDPADRPVQPAARLRGVAQALDRQEEEVVRSPAALLHG